MIFVECSEQLSVVWCADEHGLPFPGRVLDVMEEDMEMGTLIQKHGTDAFNLNLGPLGGWYLAVQSPQPVEEVLVTNGDNIYPKWPDVLIVNSSCALMCAICDSLCAYFISQREIVMNHLGFVQLYSCLQSCLRDTLPLGSVGCPPCCSERSGTPR